MEHPSVSEAAVIGVPDLLTGERIVGFVVPNPGFEILPPVLDDIVRGVVRSLGPALRPSAVHVVAELPKTQSGKIVRQAIRRAYLDEEPGDLSTVVNPGALKLFKAPR